MRIFGIDYGKAKIGLAIGVGSLSEPLKVIRVSSFENAVYKVKKEIEIEKPDKVIVGISEGTMADESKKFAAEIGADTFDETLSTRDAQELSKIAGINRKKRHDMEDAFAASVMLQSYLDTNV